MMKFLSVHSTSSNYLSVFSTLRRCRTDIFVPTFRVMRLDVAHLENPSLHGQVSRNKDDDNASKSPSVILMITLWYLCCFLSTFSLIPTLSSSQRCK